MRYPAFYGKIPRVEVFILESVLQKLPTRNRIEQLLVCNQMGSARGSSAGQGHLSGYIFERTGGKMNEIHKAIHGLREGCVDRFDLWRSRSYHWSALYRISGQECWVHEYRFAPSLTDAEIDDEIVEIGLNAYSDGVTTHYDAQNRVFMAIEYAF